MATRDTYIDGDYSRATPINPRRWSFPFRGNGDRVSALFEEDHWQTESTWTPAELGVRHPTLTDFYLIAEGDRQRVLADIVQFPRTYARIPAEQVSYSSIAINKPAFPTQDFNSAWRDSTSSTATANIWSAVITADSVVYQPTGGTFTLTWKTSTTAALAVGASSATIIAAWNALADVISDGATAQMTACIATLATNGTMAITTNGANVSNASFDGTNLTPAHLSATVTNSSVSKSFFVCSNVTTVTKTPHSITTGQSIRYSAGSFSTGGATLSGAVTVVDPNTFTLVNSNAQTPIIPNYYRRFLRTYTPGLDRVVSLLRDRFYLPGVSAGINTPADIPLPDVAINDTQLLNLITASATGFQSYDANPLARWPQDMSPIYTQRLIEIDLDDL